MPPLNARTRPRTATASEPARSMATGASLRGAHPIGVMTGARHRPNVVAMVHSTLQAGEDAERGRAARAVVPRSAHGDWAPAAGRPDPVALLTAQAATRVQELVPIRYGRMLVSPFTFYRGAAAVMAADLAATP